MLLGNMMSISCGAVFAFVVSILTRKSMTSEEVEAEWEKTRDIDNPLSPWVQVYKVRCTHNCMYACPWLTHSHHGTSTYFEYVIVQGLLQYSSLFLESSWILYWTFGTFMSALPPFFFVFHSCLKRQFVRAGGKRDLVQGRPRFSIVFENMRKIIKWLFSEDLFWWGPPLHCKLLF